MPELTDLCEFQANVLNHMNANEDVIDPGTIRKINNSIVEEVDVVDAFADLIDLGFITRNNSRQHPYKLAEEGRQWVIAKRGES